MNWNNYQRYFKSEEFKDDKGDVWMTERHMDMLYIARMKAKLPFLITSGCRNPEQNIRIGGAQSSDHLTGEGCDILCQDSTARMKIIEALLYAKFNRIGVHKDFIHAGSNKSNPQEVFWLYD